AAVPAALPAFPTRRSSDLDDVFALFETWGGHTALRGLHSQTARALAEALPRIGDYASATQAQRDRFMALLRGAGPVATVTRMARSEEHTSELQSRENLVCR